jgi:hypothetical protein
MVETERSGSFRLWRRGAIPLVVGLDREVIGSKSVMHEVIGRASISCDTWRWPRKIPVTASGVRYVRFLSLVLRSSRMMSGRDVILAVVMCVVQMLKWIAC